MKAGSISSVTVMMFFAAIIPGYLSLKLRGDISKVTIMLTAFIVVHGIYHVVRMQGAESIADNVFEPASIIGTNCIWCNLS